MINSRINRAQKIVHKNNVISLSQRRRSALRKEYPGFEGKVLVFDEAVSLASADMVQITDINRDFNRE